MVSFRIRFCEEPQRRYSCCMCTGTCHLRPEWQKAPGIVRHRELRRRLLDNLRNLRERRTLSSWRRTRSGIRVSLRPSTVKWFSASLRTISSIYVLFILWLNLLESSDPVFEGRILWSPGVRRGDNKNPIRGEHFLNNGSITLKFGDYVYIWTLVRLWSTLLMTFTLPLIGAAIAEDTEVCQWGCIRRSDQTSYSSAHFACGCLLGRPSGFPHPGQGFLLTIADQSAFKIILLSSFPDKGENTTNLLSFLGQHHVNKTLWVVVRLNMLEVLAELKRGTPRPTTSVHGSVKGDSKSPAGWHAHLGVNLC